jgi:hypothetical protein
MEMAEGPQVAMRLLKQSVFQAAKKSHPRLRFLITILTRKKVFSRFVRSVRQNLMIGWRNMDRKVQSTIFPIVLMDVSNPIRYCPTLECK